MISPQQKARFNVFGFIHLRQQFSAVEMAAASVEADRLFWEQRGGGPPTGKNQGIFDIVEKSEVFTNMLVDDRIWATVEALLGPGFIWNGSGGSLNNEGVNDKGIHHWHTDRPREPHANTYSFHLYLERLRADTGALRLIPGSHKPPLYDELLPLNEQTGETARKFLGLSPTEMPGVVIECDPGDIVFFSQKIYHGVYGMQPGRRFLKLRFAGKLETDEQIASFMRYNRRGSVYQPEEAFAKSNHPRIRAMVDPLIELAARTEAEREHFEALGASEDRY
ncbi:MAG: phytanoyl-CoA dioxygenase family protein [Caldilineaceae bacterium]|nr:phytanoyl-CoA dioxygenase family protein [Caldilineaceae bacterium]